MVVGPSSLGPGCADGEEVTSDTEDEIEDLTASVYGLVNGIDKFNVLSKGSGDSIKIGGNFLEDDSLEQYDFLGGLKDKITEAEAKLVPFFKKINRKCLGIC